MVLCLLLAGGDETANGDAGRRLVQNGRLNDVERGLKGLVSDFQGMGIIVVSVRLISGCVEEDWVPDCLGWRIVPRQSKYRILYYLLFKSCITCSITCLCD